MIKFEGLVTSAKVSKDGTKTYGEMADRETFARYSVTFPGSAAISKGDLITVQVTSVRVFDNRASFEVELLLPMSPDKTGGK